MSPEANAARSVDPARRSGPLRFDWVIGALAVVAIVLYGVGSGVRSEVVILVYVYALLGAGLYVPLVLTDQVSLAYGAYFGVGAYTFAIASSRNLFEPMLAVPLAMVLAAALAGVVAVAMSRLGGYFLAVGTLLVGTVFSRVLVEAHDVTGGPTGLGFEPVVLGIRITRIQLLVGAGFVVWATMIAVRNLRHSALGDALRLMSHSRAAAESVGLHTGAARIVSLCLGAGIASLAGIVFALRQGFVLPDSFGLEIAFLILFMPIIGGIDSPWGCLLGATIVALVLQLAPDFGPSRLLFGLVVLGFVLLFPGGILKAIGTALAAMRARSSRGIDRLAPSRTAEAMSIAASTASANPPEARSRARSSVGELLLRVRSVDKHFGGVIALSSVSFDLREGEVLGIVGPNGAGKSTLVDIVTGVQQPDSGTITLSGVELREGTSGRAKLGMARTFQHPLLAQALSIRDNVRLGLLREAAPRTGLRMFYWFVSSMLLGRGERRFSGASKPADTRSADAEDLESAAGLLAHEFESPASEVSYAVEKIAEVIRALISRPRLLLMDEPFAGLDRASIHTLWATVLRWRAEALGTIVVDHNVDLLREICDRIIVLDRGRVIAEGAPDEVMTRRVVREAYFGERDN